MAFGPRTVRAVTHLDVTPRRLRAGGGGARRGRRVSDPIYFTGPEAFRAWLEAHHETETEVFVGY